MTPGFPSKENEPSTIASFTLDREERNVAGTAINTWFGKTVYQMYTNQNSRSQSRLLGSEVSSTNETIVSRVRNIALFFGFIVGFGLLSSKLACSDLPLKNWNTVECVAPNMIIVFGAMGFIFNLTVALVSCRGLYEE